MPLEAVRSISEAEEASRKMKSDAVAAAKKAAADAERDGRAELENASRRAAGRQNGCYSSPKKKPRELHLNWPRPRRRKRLNLGNRLSCVCTKRLHLLSRG